MSKLSLSYGYFEDSQKFESLYALNDAVPFIISTFDSKKSKCSFQLLRAKVPDNPFGVTLKLLESQRTIFFPVLQLSSQKYPNHLGF